MRSGRSEAELDFSSSVLRTILQEVTEKYHIRDIILTEKEEIRPWARVLVNGRSQEFIGGLDMLISDGDRIALVYPYAEAF